MKTSHWLSILLAAGLAVLVSACVAQTDPALPLDHTGLTTTQSYPAPVIDSEQSVTTSYPNPVGIDPIPASTSLPAKPSTTWERPVGEVEKQVIKDLAGRLGIDTGKVSVVNIYSDEFPAGDLGCPSPGVTPRPIPAIVSGKVIELEANGEEYIYHTHGVDFVYCGTQ